jgi:UDP-N-acetylglucosamine 2-epimerase (non-hydrolysing)
MPSTQPRILLVFGTRPEVIKLAPLDHALRARRDWQVTLCNTGQHRELVPPLLATFGLAPEVELGVMLPGQSLSSLTARLLDALDPVLDALRFDWVVVQGDTTTALAAALAAHHRRVPVAHVEAGLRTHDLAAPFPEEANRQLIGRLASLHLAPTAAARAALLAEGVPDERIVVTGNTVVDAGGCR